MNTWSCADRTSTEGTATGSGLVFLGWNGQRTGNQRQAIALEPLNLGGRHAPLAAGRGLGLNHSVLAQKPDRGQGDPQLAGDLPGGIEKAFHVSNHTEERTVIQRISGPSSGFGSGFCVVGALCGMVSA